MIDLLDVTLLTISGTNDTNMFLEHLRSLYYSKKHINFGKIKILSPIKPIEVLDYIEYVKIKKLSYEEYSNFIINYTQLTHEHYHYLVQIHLIHSIFY